MAAGIPMPELDPKELEGEVDRVLSPFTTSGDANPFYLKEEIARNMWEHVGIVRNELDLTAGLKEVEQISGEAKMSKAVGPRTYNQSWLDTLQVWDMLMVSEAIIRSALERKESRGAHGRSDFPGKNERWLVNIITVRKGGRMVHEQRPIPKPPADLAALIKE
jgi:succinate dehydrogenase / fumarate reductase flavoprotein subunit